VLTPTCVWRISDDLVVALDQRFGEPTDAYVNGSQVWLRDDGPGDITIEWRLHPVAGYTRPPSVETVDVFPATALALVSGDVPPAPLATAVSAALGITPDASGLVDHQKIGDQWERSRGSLSIIDCLLAELAPG
jgi:hypothetical protein